MLTTIVFLATFIIGCVIGYGIYYHKKMKKMEEKKIIEQEIIDNLKELKEYISPISEDTKREFSKEFDLVEIALEYNLIDIIITDEEGFIVASTLKDDNNLGAILVNIYNYIVENMPDVKKLIISRENSYLYVFRLKLYGENLYITLESKIMLDLVLEKEILKKIYEILKTKYLAPVSNINKIEVSILEV